MTGVDTLELIVFFDWPLAFAALGHTCGFLSSVIEDVIGTLRAGLACLCFSLRTDGNALGWSFGTSWT